MNQVPRQTTSENDDDPGAIPGQEHEAEIGAARDRIGVGQPRRAVLLAEQALDDERQPEGQQQAVEVIEVIEARDEQPLDDDADDADDDRRQHQRPPVGNADDTASSIQAQKAPIMYCAPCVKLMTFMRPKITASPSDSSA